MAKIYRVIQIKLNQLVQENVRIITDLPIKRIKRYHSDKNFLDFFAYKMAAKINWHRYGTKLRNCHPMYM